jgi:hypothetical protein
MSLHAFMHACISWPNQHWRDFSIHRAYATACRSEQVIAALPALPAPIVPYSRTAGVWQYPVEIRTSKIQYLHVTRAGRHVYGSPFSVRVMSAGTCATTSTVVGGGVSVCTAGVPSAFTIIARDAFLNLRDDTSSSDTFAVRVNQGANIRPAHIAFSAGAEARYPVSYTLTRAGTSALSVSLLSRGGLTATYYANDALDPANAIASEWSTNSVDWSSAAGSAPWWAAGSAATALSARWSGLIELQQSPPASGVPYTFYTTLKSMAEGVKVWVDNVMIIDQWQSITALEFGATIQLGAGGIRLYDILIEYKGSFAAPATMGLNIKWESPTMAKAKISAYAQVPSAHVPSPPLACKPSPPCATVSTMSGIGLSIATAGASSRLDIVARDSYSNVISSGDIVSWQLTGAGLTNSPTELRSSEYTVTASGAYALSASLLHAGGLQATYYTDTAFQTPRASGPVLGSLGEFNGGVLGSLVRDEYFSVRWTGLMRLPAAEAGEFTFFSATDEAVRMQVGGRVVFDHVPGSLESVPVGKVLINTPGHVDATVGVPLLLELRHVTGPFLNGLDLRWRVPGQKHNNRIPPSVLLYQMQVRVPSTIHTFLAVVSHLGYMHVRLHIFKQALK